MKDIALIFNSKVMKMNFEDVKDKERYFIQPYVEGEYRKVIISSKNGVVSIRFFNKDGKKTKAENKIKKELSKLYANSKFNGFSTILEGVLSTDNRNITHLILFDIMLEDEYTGRIQSKKYQIRYENLIFRFMDKYAKLVKPVFSHQFGDITVKLVIDQFIKTDALNRLLFRKNIPRGYENDEIIVEDIWTPCEGTIVGYETGEDVKREFDEKQNLKIEQPFEYLKSFKISVNGDVKTVELSNFGEAKKVDMLYDASSYEGKKCLLKKYKVVNYEGFVFTSLK